MMEELKYELVKYEIDNNSLGVTKGYGYVNKEGNQRYMYNDVYYTDGERVCRKVVNDRGEFFYNIELMDVVVETFVTKDGNPGKKVYPLSEVPYLCADYENVDLDALKNYLSFKLHR